MERNLIFALNEIEYRVFSANQRLSLGRETCGHNLAWKPAPNQSNLAAAESGSAEMGKPQVYSHPSESHDLHSGAPVATMTWLRFRTSLVAASAWAVVTTTRSTAGSSSLFLTLGVNFFVAGRIAWRKDLADDKYELGAPYLRAQGHLSPLHYLSTSVSARDSASSNTATP
jgi:hypothetical protein